MGGRVKQIGYVWDPENAREREKIARKIILMFGFIMENIKKKTNIIKIPQKFIYFKIFLITFQIPNGAIK